MIWTVDGPYFIERRNQSFQITIVYASNISRKDTIRYADYMPISKPNFHIFIANKILLITVYILTLLCSRVCAHVGRLGSLSTLVDRRA